jgi:hypothetical protein
LKIKYLECLFNLLMGKLDLGWNNIKLKGNRYLRENKRYWSIILINFGVRVKLIQIHIFVR